MQSWKCNRGHVTLKCNMNRYNLLPPKGEEKLRGGKRFSPSHTVRVFIQQVLSFLETQFGWI